jgi:hypothetical protein
MNNVKNSIILLLSTGTGIVVGETSQNTGLGIGVGMSAILVGIYARWFFEVYRGRQS